MFKTKKEILFTILTGFFVTNAVFGELVGGKLIQIGPYALSIGIIPWPIVFLSTDIINEYFGKSGVRKLTMMTAALILYIYVLLIFGIKVPAAENSPVTDVMFNGVFAQSQWIIIGSTVAFISSQLVDMLTFWLIRKKTGNRLVWLRATGSTAVSQIIDSFIVTGIAFYLPGVLPFKEYVEVAILGYLSKLIISLIISPLIIVLHKVIDKYLGEEESKRIVEETAMECLKPSDLK